MECVERDLGTTTVLEITGPITMGSTREFRERIDSLVRRARTQIVLNLGGVSYVDSAGLGELLAAFTTVSTTGGKMKLVNLTHRIDELLIVTKLSTVFEIWPTENEAVASFS